MRAVWPGDSPAGVVSSRSMLGRAVEQLAPLEQSALVPRGERIGVPCLQRGANLGQTPGELVEGRDERLAVGEIDVGPDRGVGARHSDLVAQAGAGGPRRCPARLTTLRLP